MIYQVIQGYRRIRPVLVVQEAPVVPADTDSLRLSSLDQCKLPFLAVQLVLEHQRLRLCLYLPWDQSLQFVLECPEFQAALFHLLNLVPRLMCGPSIREYTIQMK